MWQHGWEITPLSCISPQLNSYYFFWPLTLDIRTHPRPRLLLLSTQPWKRAGRRLGAAPLQTCCTQLASCRGAVWLSCLLLFRGEDEAKCLETAPTSSPSTHSSEHKNTLTHICIALTVLLSTLHVQSQQCCPYSFESIGELIYFWCFSTSQPYISDRYTFHLIRLIAQSLHSALPQYNWTLVMHIKCPHMFWALQPKRNWSFIITQYEAEMNLRDLISHSGLTHLKIKRTQKQNKTQTTTLSKTAWWWSSSTWFALD